MAFSDVEEVNRAFTNKKVGLQARIKVRVKEQVKNESGELQFRSKIQETTVGRALLYQIVPEGISFSEINPMMGNQDISKLINLCYRTGFEGNCNFCRSDYVHGVRVFYKIWFLNRRRGFCDSGRESDYYFRS